MLGYMLFYSVRPCGAGIPVPLSPKITTPQTRVACALRPPRVSATFLEEGRCAGTPAPYVRGILAPHVRGLLAPSVHGLLA
jgi:hypothetical protein